MELPEVVTAAFYDELEKIAIAHGRTKALRARSGRRPMSVTTLLKKEKDGSLYKNTGTEHKIAQVEPFLAGQLTGAEARAPKKKGEPPSRENQDGQVVPKWEDGRGNATTVNGQGVSLDVGGKERSE